MKKILMGLVLVCLLLTLTGCSCKHEETKLINAKDATCTTDGYTGDTVCDKCGKVVLQGQVISAKGHILSELMGVKEATCYNEGYTGDIYCTLCSEKVVSGEVIPMTDHVPGERSNVREASCNREGYTGDVYCQVCYALLEEGDSIPMTEHTPGEPYRPYEPTCTEDGYTGTIYCDVCGEWLQDGETIPALGHTLGEPLNYVEPTCLADGYSGDTVCSVCERTFSGEVLPKLEHSFDETHTCTACGWMEPGLYIEGKLQFTWDEMIANNYVTVDSNNRLTAVTKSLYGHLVVAEGLTLNSSSNLMNESALNSVYLPASVDRIPYRCFADSPALESVRAFGHISRVEDSTFENCPLLKEFIVDGGFEDLGAYCFRNCTSLENISLPEGLVRIRSACFAGTSLSEVTLPSTLQSIEESAFEGCVNLTRLELPEALESIGKNFLNNTGVTELIVPANVSSFSHQEGAQFVSVDLSKSAITDIEGQTFKDNVALENIMLPEGLLAISDGAFIGCSSLQRLELPASLTEIYDGWSGDFSSCTKLTTLVWPAGLTDGSLLTTLPNLKNILYRGSQLQWDLTVSKDLFADKTVVVDYVPEG